MDITFLAPCKDLSGGIKVISIYANKLLEYGHNVTVVYPKKQIPLLRKLKRETLKFLKNEKDHLDYFNGRLLAVETVNEQTVPKGDILIATAWETAEWAKNLSHAKGEKYYFIQGYETWGGQKERVNKTLRYPFKKFTVSSWLKETVSEISGDDDIKIIPNATDYNLTEREALNNDRIYDVGMIYSAIPNKGGRIGIDAFWKISALNPNAKFVIFGVDAPQEKLPPNTKVHVKPSQKKIAEIYRSTKIWMSSSYEEGFCLPCLEAMSNGCAVVSTDNKGVRDFIDDKYNGFLTLPGRPTDLAAKVHFLLNSPNFYDRFRRNGFHKSRMFSWDKSAEKLNQLFLAEIKKKAA